MSVNIIDFIKALCNKIKLFSEDAFVTKSDMRKFYLVKNLTPYVTITASTNWTLNSSCYLKITGNLMTVYISAKYSSKIANGAISNLQIATITIPTYATDSHCPPISKIFRVGGASATSKGPNAFYTNTSNATSFTVALTSTHAAIAANTYINTTMCFPIVFSSASELRDWVRGW